MHASIILAPLAISLCIDDELDFGGSAFDAPGPTASWYTDKKISYSAATGACEQDVALEHEEPEAEVLCEEEEQAQIQAWQNTLDLLQAGPEINIRAATIFVAEQPAHQDEMDACQDIDPERIIGGDHHSNRLGAAGLDSIDQQIAPPAQPPRLAKYSFTGLRAKPIFLSSQDPRSGAKRDIGRFRNIFQSWRSRLGHALL